MRRCGRMACLFGAGLLVATFVTGGALAAPGGNGKGKSLGLANGHAKQASSQGNGLALANGHEKNAPATPQLTPPAEPAGVQAPAAARPKAEKPSAPAAASNAAVHLTICHATGSGRYIVISPSVTGVMNGHFKHHDDFVYEGSCTRPAGGSAGSPPAEPPVDPPTPTHPPQDPPAVDPAPPALRPSGDLPFTGVSALWLAGIGAVLLAAGLVLKRRAPLPQHDEGV
jgi:hypothetical protein